MSKEQVKKTAKVKLQPLQDRVLIKEDTSSSERKTGAGIIIPVTSNEDKESKKGEVIAVGPGRLDDEGRLIPVNIEVGDIVLFQWGDKIKVKEDEYYLVKESEILAVIK